MKDLHIITVYFDYPNNQITTYEKKLFADFDSSDFNRIYFKSEDYGKKNESLYFKFTLFRIVEMLKYVEEHILGKYKYLLLLDGTDIGYVGGIQNFKDILNEYNTKMLFGAETNLWPGTEYSHLYENKQKGRFTFLNAGTMITEVEFYHKKLKDVIERGKFGLCDQGNWQIEYLLCENSDIEIDYKKLLVLNTFNAKDEFTIVDNKVQFIDKSPIFIHDNGGFTENTIKLLEYFK